MIVTSRVACPVVNLVLSMTAVVFLPEPESDSDSDDEEESSSLDLIILPAIPPAMIPAATFFLLAEVLLFLAWLSSLSEAESSLLSESGDFWGFLTAADGFFLTLLLSHSVLDLGLLAFLFFLALASEQEPESLSLSEPESDE